MQCLWRRWHNEVVVNINTVGFLFVLYLFIRVFLLLQGLLLPTMPQDDSPENLKALIAGQRPDDYSKYYCG